MCNPRARPQQCWKSCANGWNLVALSFGDHGTKEMLEAVSNFAKQLPTTCNSVGKRTQSVTSNNFLSWTHNSPAPNISGFIAQLVRASHRYREVMGSNTDEVGKFFSGFLRNCNCINCVHNSEDHSSLDFMIYFIYIYHNVSSVCKASLLFLTTDLFIECYYVFLYLYICCKWKERKTVKP